jgi:acetyltransferase-like isoleucine patch superfamily enzyme
MNKQGYVAPNAKIYHADLHLGDNVFIGERVVIFQGREGGSVRIGKGSHIHQDCIIETGFGGCLTLGADTHIQPRCQFSSYLGSLVIGSYVQIAPYCSFYPYNHGYAPGELIKKQPLQTKGGIFIDDDAWLGVNVIVLDGVRIGRGAVIGAGSVVTGDIPDGAIAIGTPARIIKMRSALVKQKTRRRPSFPEPPIGLPHVS